MRLRRAAQGLPDTKIGNFTPELTKSEELDGDQHEERGRFLKIFSFE
jgi:hypothetical protein